MKFLKNYKYFACRVLDRIGLLKHFSFELSLKVGSKRFLIPVRGQVGYPNLLPFTEQWMQEIIRRSLVESPGTIIDVGMNIGQTILKAENIGSITRYIGFEPNPVCYSYCNELAKRNGLKNYSLFPVGLSNCGKVVALYADNDHAAGASIIRDFREDKERYQEIHRVAVMAGDSILEEEGVTNISLVKLDIEGAELEALQGLKRSLARTRPAVVLEILPVYDLDKDHLRARKERQDNLYEFMQVLGYRAFLVNEEDNRLTPLDSIPVHGDMSRTNYLFLNPDKQSQFLDIID